MPGERSRLRRLPLSSAKRCDKAIWSEAIYCQLIALTESSIGMTNAAGSHVSTDAREEEAGAMLASPTGGPVYPR
jgi:hypothetical protein